MEGSVEAMVAIARLTSSRMPGGRLLGTGLPVSFIEVRYIAIANSGNVKKGAFANEDRSLYQQVSMTSCIVCTIIPNLGEGVIVETRARQDVSRRHSYRELLRKPFAKIVQED